MKKLDSHPLSLTFSPDPSTTLRHGSASQRGGSGRRPKLGGRLIVLVPSLELDLSAAAHRIWELANAGSGHVLLLGLYEDIAQELSLRRQLAGMAAVVGSAGIFTETEIEFGNDWAEAVRSRTQAGDMVACFAGHRVGRLNRPLSHVLQANLDMPLYILSGSYLQASTRSNRWTQITLWVGFIAILIGFFLLQVRIQNLTSGSVLPVLVLVSVCLESWMIWVWNSLFK